MTQIWGIDPGLKGLAVAHYDKEANLKFDFLEPSKRQRDVYVRVFEIRDKLRTLILECTSREMKPEAVFLEVPFILNKSSVYSLYAVFAMVRLTCDDYHIPVFEVVNTVWKRVIMGRGNVSHEEVKGLMLIANPDLDPNMREDFYAAYGVLKYGEKQLKELG